MSCNRRQAVALLATAIGASASAPAAASGSTRLVVPSTAGSVSYKLAQALTAAWPTYAGRTLVALERPGGSGTLALQEMARGPKDGSMLMLANTGTQVVRPHAAPSVQVDALCPIAKLASVAGVLVANRAVPAATWPEFVALARARPGHWSYASAGVGSLGHLVMEAVCAQAGIRLLHVPYKSSAEPLSDLLGGRVHLHLLSMSATLPLARQGRIRALALGSSVRAPQLSDVPTFIELGHEGADIENWQGLFVHKDVNPRTQQRLHEAALSVLQDVSFRQALLVERLEPAPATSTQAFARLIDAQHGLVDRMVRRQRLRLI